MVSAIIPSLRTVSLASGALGATATLEMAIRAIGNLANLDGAGRRDLSANLGGAIFYGACCLNLVPGTRLIGAAIFTTYSLYKPKAYFTSTAIRTTVEKIGEHVVKPIWEHIVSPVVERIWRVVQAILQHIRLPEHPIWYAIALLGAAVWFKYGADFNQLIGDVRARFVV